MLNMLNQEKNKKQEYAKPKIRSLGKVKGMTKGGWGGWSGGGSNGVGGCPSLNQNFGS